MPKNSIAKNANAVISNAAAAYESKIQTKEIEPLKDVDPKLVRVTRLAFEHDWDSGLSQEVRDVISYTTTAEYTNAEAPTHNPTELPRFMKVDGRLSEIYKEYFLSHTEFLIDVQRLSVNPASAGSIWTQFINHLGDLCCCFVRNLGFKFAGGEIDVQVMKRHFQAVLETPHVAAAYDKQQYPAFMAKHPLDGEQAIEWLKKQFTAIHDQRQDFFGASRFGMRDINKIGKVMFRLPAVCHLLQKKRSEMSTNGEDPLPEMAEVMEHGNSCVKCGVQWVAEADGAF